VILCVVATLLGPWVLAAIASLAALATDLFWELPDVVAVVAWSWDSILALASAALLITWSMIVDFPVAFALGVSEIWTLRCAERYGWWPVRRELWKGAAPAPEGPPAALPLPRTE
jgi:hypothetical protein